MGPDYVLTPIPVREKSTPTIVYVLSQEHYHFPPNDSDMVAATPREVYTDYNLACVEAHREASRQAVKYELGEVKEYMQTNREYRCWVESSSAVKPDGFVWVVRATKFKG
jgi:hypothetical protein